MSCMVPPITLRRKHFLRCRVTRAQQAHTAEIFELLGEIRRVLGITEREMAQLVTLPQSDFSKMMQKRDTAKLPPQVTEFAERIARGIAYATAYPIVADEIRLRLAKHGADAAIGFLLELSNRGRVFLSNRHTFASLPEGTRLRRNLLLKVERGGVIVVDCSERNLIGQQLATTVLEGWFEEEDFGV